MTLISIENRQRIKDISELPPFRVSCSQISKLVAASPFIKQKELDRIAFLESKKAGKVLSDKTGKPLSLQAKEKTELQRLVAKRDNKNPQLGATAKKMIQDWVKGQMWGKRRPDTGSIQTDKGNICEAAIGRLIQRVNGIEFLSKNQERKSNEWIEGEIDFKTAITQVTDAKSSFNCFTFPAFATANDVDADYWWQGQGYMILWDVKEYVIFCGLLNLPEELLLSLANRAKYSYKNKDKLIEDIYEELEGEHNYEHFADEDLHKMFVFDRDPRAEEYIIKHVKLARKYISTLKYERKVKAVAPNF